jgi:protein-S-isoprenylcysteine O-methyltransferase Ste14
MTAADHLIVAAAWLSFSLGHSLLTASWAQQRSQALVGRWSRLAYNGFAGIHLAAVLWVGERWISGAPLATVVEGGLWFDGARLSVSVIGALILVIAARDYDLGRFFGLAQLRGDALGDERLQVQRLHRFIRHPLYTGSMLILWARVETDAHLATAIWTSAYFMIGSIFEERKLVRLYCQAYRDYHSDTPAFLPWRRGGSV